MAFRLVGWGKNRAHRPPAHANDWQTSSVDNQWRVGMTSSNEQAYLRWLVARRFSGQGAIVELGCWLGSLTSSLAMGLRENPHHAVTKIHVRSVRLGTQHGGDGFVRDYFRWTYHVPDAGSVIFQLGKMLSGDVLSFPDTVSTISSGKVDDACARWFEHVDPGTQKIMAAAHVMCYASEENLSLARVPYQPYKYMHNRIPSLNPCIHGGLR
jgi:hypothetical protein